MLYTATILLILAIAILLFYKNTSVFVACATLILLVSASYFVPQQVHVENFEDNNAVETLKPPLTDRLRLYVTTTGENSFQDKSLTWVDIRSVQEDTDQTARNLEFSQHPTFDYPRNGIFLKNVNIAGPQSVSLGLRGTDDFSFAWYLTHITGYEESIIKPFFTVYANTWSNIGIRVGFMKDTIVVQENLDGGTTLNTHNIKLEAGTPISSYHLFSVVRQGNKLSVYVDNKLQGNVSVGVTDVLFSNKAFEIHSQDVQLCMFAIYKRVLNTDDMTKLINHIEERRVKLHDMYSSLWKERQEMLDKKQCGLVDKSICQKECSQVTDWTDVNTVMMNANQQCKNAIVAYCTSNTTDPFCGCWLPENEKNESCGVVRSFFKDNLIPKESCPVSPQEKGYTPKLEKYYRDLRVSGEQSSNGLASNGLASGGQTSNEFAFELKENIKIPPTNSVSDQDMYLALQDAQLKDENLRNALDAIDLPPPPENIFSMNQL